VSNTRELKLRRNRATTIFFIAVTLLLAYLSYQIARPFLTAIAWATILAVIFFPIHTELRRLIRGPNLCATASTVVTMLVGVLPIALLVMAVTREATQGYQQIRERIGSGPPVSETIRRVRGVSRTAEWAEARLRDLGVDLEAILREGAQYAGELALSIAKGTITSLSSFLINTILVAFTLFFFFRDGPQILNHLQRIMPIESETAGGVYQLVGQVIRAAINGIVVISLIKGVLAGLAFWALGLPSPVLWGAVSAVVSVIPVFGTSLVWVPASVLLWMQGHPVKALIMVIWGATALSLIDNILYPLLVRNQVRLHTLLVFFSSLGGLAVFGFLGFVLGPVVATLALTLVEVASDYYAGSARAPAVEPEIETPALP
jgi:predicted PurR-regulated permease PerM